MSTQPDDGKEVLYVRIPAETKAALEKSAIEAHRTIAGQVSYLLETVLKEGKK